MAVHPNNQNGEDSSDVNKITGILTYIGKLIIPGTVVHLISGALGASTRVSASIALLAVIIIAIVIHRRTISQLYMNAWNFIRANFKWLIFIKFAGPSSGMFIVVKFLGVSNFKALSIAMLIAAFVYVAIYKRFVNQHIKSHWVLLISTGSTIIVLGLSDFWTLHIFRFSPLSRATGIIEYHKHANDFLPKIKKYISEAKDDICIVGVSFYITVPERKDDFLEKLKEGVSIRFLVYDFLSENKNLNEVAAGFNQTPKALINECIMTVEGLREIVEQWDNKNQINKFEVRLFKSEPRTRFYIFDRRREEGYTYFVPHVYYQNSPNLPGYLAKNISTGVTPAYIEGVERLWKNSIDLDIWWKKYERYKKEHGSVTQNLN